VPAENPTMVAFGGESGQQMIVATAEGSTGAGQVLSTELSAEVSWHGIEEPLVTVI